MGIGHFAVGLALKKAEPRMNLGSLIFAAFLADFLLGVFVWLGMEQYQVPSDVAAKHYLTFTFPYSHGLAATILWSLLAAGLAFGLASPSGIRSRAAWIIAGAVFSHFILDAVVHVVGLPLFGGDSSKIGLGLWNHLGLELSLEIFMAVVGLVIYLQCTQGRGLLACYGMIVLMALLTPAMVIGQATMTSAPPPSGLIASWILAPLLLALSAYRLDRARAPA